jgi:hypothetical protein
MVAEVTTVEFKVQKGGLEDESTVIEGAKVIESDKREKWGIHVC